MPTEVLTAVMLTVYFAPDGAVLYCDTWDTDLAYTTDDRWIAWDFAVHGGQCGDWIAIADGGVTRTFKAFDSGKFATHCVIIGDECPPIAADLPAHLAWFPGLSVQVERVRNLSAIERRVDGMWRRGGLVQ